jgi:hypothetical protein
MSESELLPCPFCGGKAETFYRGGGLWGTDCVLGCRSAAATRDEAVAGWNRRATSDAAVRRSAITEAVDRLTDDAAIALGDAVESAKYYEVRSGHNRAREKSAACIRAALRRALTEGT